MGIMQTLCNIYLSKPLPPEPWLVTSTLALDVDSLHEASKTPKTKVSPRPTTHRKETLL